MIEDPDPANEGPGLLQRPTALVQIDVSLQNPIWHALNFDAEALCRQAVRDTLSAIGSDSGALEISVVLGDDELLRRLNLQTRGFDRPTNVLAFPGDSPGDSLPDGAPRLLGDVLLSHETIAGEARQQEKPLENHLRHMVVHGVLHLLGYGHETEIEAKTMEALETIILAGMEVPDPYQIGSRPMSEPA